jgi:hypothetical protein
MESSTRTTIGHVLKTVFPDGTQFFSDDVRIHLDNGENTQTSDTQVSSWEAIPVLPFDVFAFCAYLIEITGLMGFFDPDPGGASQFKNDTPLRVALSQTDRDACRTSSANWATNGKPDDYTIKLWKQIFDCETFTIRIRDYQRYHKKATSSTAVEAPQWWVAAFKLLIIADEACDEVGHSLFGNENTPLFKKLMPSRMKDGRIKEGDVAAATSGSWVRAEKQFATLAVSADRGVVCVQPKGRVSEVGCSLRNISRNLAITGPVGAVRCSWQQLDSELDFQESDSLNLLMIPLPYHMSAKWFGQQNDLKAGSKWGNFTVKQEWLPQCEEDFDVLSDFVVNLIKEAQKDVEKINGIIFPEYSLSYPIFEHLMEKVFIATNGKIEFMISGSSSNCDGDKCNCVLTAVWEEQSKKPAHDSPASTPGNRRVRVISQRKHHRWKLTEAQIKDYGIASSLPPFIEWWEDHEIDAREINFFQFRKNAVFTSLICEDLARNDPCHDIIRSVAPNLIFALLMDGPQLTNRWSARYASTLADDPGSTVLTLTSRGLLQRSNNSKMCTQSHSVGLLKDDTGQTQELIVGHGEHAVVVTLASRPVRDFTIDGRPTTNASSWHYINQKPIKLDKTCWDSEGRFIPPSPPLQSPSSSKSATPRPQWSLILPTSAPATPHQRSKHAL